MTNKQAADREPMAEQGGGVTAAGNHLEAPCPGVVGGHQQRGVGTCRCGHALSLHDGGRRCLALEKSEACGCGWQIV
jgi:hypothetical protein